MADPTAHGEGYAFGPFRLDVLERTLNRDGEPVRLRARCNRI